MVRQRGIAVVVALLLAFGSGQALAAPTGPPEGPLPVPPALATPSAAVPVPVPPSVVSGPSEEDWATNIFQRSLLGSIGSIDDFLRGVVDGVSGGGHDFIRSTPPTMTADNPTVRAAWGAVAGIAGAFVAALLIWSGLCITVAPVLRMTHEEALILLPRTALGVAMIAGSLWLGSQVIALNNAATAAIGVALPAWDATLGANPTFPDVLARLFYLVAAILLLLQMLMRIAKLDVLLVLAPVAWVCWVAPQTRGWWSLWARQFVGTVFAQFVQLLALKLGVNIIGLGGGQGTLVPLFLGMAIIWFVYKIPGLMEGYASTGWVTALTVTRVVQTGAGVVGGGAGAVFSGVGGAAAKAGAAGAAIDRALPADLAVANVWRGGRTRS